MRADKASRQSALRSFGGDACEIGMPLGFHQGRENRTQLGERYHGSRCPSWEVVEHYRSCESTKASMVFSTAEASLSFTNLSRPTFPPKPSIFARPYFTLSETDSFAAPPKRKLYLAQESSSEKRILVRCLRAAHMSTPLSHCIFI